MSLEKLNASLDRFVRTELVALGKSRPAFRVCGYAGFSLAVLLTSGLAVRMGLSLLVMAGIAVVSVSTFLALVMATKIMTSEERIIYYHHEIAVMLATTLFVWLLRQPVLAFLDVTILGIGLFLVCGRIGCFMVGCCHGRPSQWGVCYREEHATAGFIPHYVGVRLFPVQAVESLWVLCVASIGVAYVLLGFPPGTALGWYVTAYSLGRFWIEFLRGDPDRSYLWGFSEPQWTSLLLMIAVAAGELANVLPRHELHLWLAASVAIAMPIIAIKRRFQRINSFRLLHPNHVREVAHALEAVSKPAIVRADVCDWTVFPTKHSEAVLVGRTSLDVQISAGSVSLAAGGVRHYSVSYKSGGMTEDEARILTDLILRLRGALGRGEIVNGGQGVFHLLIHSKTKKEPAC